MIEKGQTFQNREIYVDESIINKLNEISDYILKKYIIRWLPIKEHSILIKWTEINVYKHLFLFIYLLL